MSFILFSLITLSCCGVGFSSWQFRRVNHILSKRETTNHNENLSHKYSNYNSIIKFISFKPIYYVFKMGVTKSLTFKFKKILKWKKKKDILEPNPIFRK